MLHWPFGPSFFYTRSGGHLIFNTFLLTWHYETTYSRLDKLIQEDHATLTPLSCSMTGETKLSLIMNMKSFLKYFSLILMVQKYYSNSATICIISLKLLMTLWTWIWPTRMLSDMLQFLFWLIKFCISRSEPVTSQPISPNVSRVTSEATLRTKNAKRQRQVLKLLGCGGNQTVYSQLVYSQLVYSQLV